MWLYFHLLFDIGKNQQEELIITEDTEEATSFQTTNKKEIKWRKHIHYEWENFTYEAVQPNVIEPLSPIAYFYEYIPDEIFCLMAQNGKKR